MGDTADQGPAACPGSTFSPALARSGCSQTGCSGHRRWFLIDDERWDEFHRLLEQPARELLKLCPADEAVAVRRRGVSVAGKPCALTSEALESPSDALHLLLPSRTSTRAASTKCPRAGVTTTSSTSAERYGCVVCDGSGAEGAVQPLPDFGQPPLTEVALGVVFEPIDIGIVGLAELHQRWRAEYPRVEEHPALPPLFAPPSPTPGLLIEVGQPQLRLWMIAADEDRLVQVQRDRLVVNWRRTGSGDYPRYHSLRAVLDRHLDDLWSFLRERSAPVPAPVAAEATYVNTIQAENPADFLAAMNPLPERLGRPSEANVSLVFDTTSSVGRPQRVALLAGRDQGQEGYFIFRVSVLAQVSDSGEFADALAASHEQAVRTFTEVTTEAMHDMWGRRA